VLFIIASFWPPSGFHAITGFCAVITPVELAEGRVSQVFLQAIEMGEDVFARGSSDSWRKQHNSHPGCASKTYNVMGETID
jgi:hypothetical protein